VDYFSVGNNYEMKELSVLFMGDLCPIGKVANHIHDNTMMTVDANLFNTLKNKDISIANLECPLTFEDLPIMKVGPHLKADPLAVNLLKYFKLDVLSLANNHIMDFGEKGLVDTIEALENSGMQYVGAGMNLSDSLRPLKISCKSIRISILSYCETEFNIADRNSAGCAPIPKEDLYDQIKKAKKASDLVIVSLHCGSEHYPLPSPRIRKLCRLFAKNGVSAVVCHHTHIYSGYEIYQGVPIFYGLGNFIFDLHYRKFPSHWHYGYMVRIDFSKDSAIGFSLIPYEFCPRRMALLGLYNSDKAKFDYKIQQLSNIINNEEKLEFIWKQYSVYRYRYWYLPEILKSLFNPMKPSKNRNMVLWHYRTNESHSDVIKTALDEQRQGFKHSKYEMELRKIGVKVDNSTFIHRALKRFIRF
jgi:capsule synthesis protein PGA_cap